MNAIDTYWNHFLQKQNMPNDTRFQDVFHFELTEYWANELLRLVLIGQKRATASSMAEFSQEGRKLPEVGDYYILTDWSMNPRCIVRVNQVTILPFREMAWELARREGEDDTLESWKTGHRKFFSAEGQTLGYEFNEDMLVVFEEFDVVFKEAD